MQSRLISNVNSSAQTDRVANVQQRSDPNNINVLAEPKFDLPDGEVYTGGWCRPQNDGPAARATTNMLLLESGLWSNAALVEPLVFKDLDYVAASWHQPGCDLWEEIRSTDLFWGLTHSLMAMTFGLCCSMCGQSSASC
jgi:glucoamylase